MANYSDTRSERDTERKTMDQQKARQGVTLGHIRYVLGISLVLAAIAGAIVYFAFF